MKANQVFSVETPNGTLLVRDEEMKEVLKLLKVRPRIFPTKFHLRHSISLTLVRFGASGKLAD